VHVDSAGQSGGDARRHSGVDHLADRPVGRADLDPALLDGHRGALGVRGNGEGRPFDQSDQIGRLHSEMRSRLLLDPEGGPAPILEHLDDTALLGGRRKPKPGAGGDDHIFLTAHQDRASVGAGGDDIARLKRRAARGGGGSSAMLHLHRSGRFGHSPGRDLGERGMAPEKQQDDEGAQEHGVGTFGSGRVRLGPASLAAKACEPLRGRA